MHNLETVLFCDVFKRNNPNPSLFKIEVYLKGLLKHLRTSQSRSCLNNVFNLHKCNFFNLATAFILTYNSFSHKRILALISGLLLDSHVHDVAFFAGH